MPCPSAWPWAHRSPCIWSSYPSGPGHRREDTDRAALAGSQAHVRSLLPLSDCQGAGALPQKGMGGESWGAVSWEAEPERQEKRPVLPLCEQCVPMCWVLEMALPSLRACCSHVPGRSAGSHSLTSQPRETMGCVNHTAGSGGDSATAHLNSGVQPHCPGLMRQAVLEEVALWGSRSLAWCGRTSRGPHSQCEVKSVGLRPQAGVRPAGPRQGTGASRHTAGEEVTLRTPALSRPCTQEAVLSERNLPRLLCHWSRRPWLWLWLWLWLSPRELGLVCV